MGSHRRSDTMGLSRGESKRGQSALKRGLTLLLAIVRIV